MLLVLALLLGACGEARAPESLRLVTLEDANAAGLALRELPAATLESIGLPYGLAVVQAGAAGELAGLRIGDVVYGVERTPVGSLEEFSRLVSKRADGRIGLLVRRGKDDFYVAVQLRARPQPALPARDTLLRT
jgi:S1-C subfamily serine protease